MESSLKNKIDKSFVPNCSTQLFGYDVFNIQQKKQFVKVRNYFLKTQKS